MGSYVPNTTAQQQEMLATIGLSSMKELYKDVPQDMILDKLNIAPGKSEMEVREIMSDYADQNKIFKTVLRGAGAYRHFIPAVVKEITTREELVTCYTPYQAEISQGVLQGIFEFQTMICELTGMDVSNASHYDGGTAAAETIPMCKDRKRTKAYVSGSVNPQIIETMKTYCFASNTELIVTDEELKNFVLKQIFPGIDYETLEDDMKANLDKIAASYLKDAQQVEHLKNQLADIKMTAFLKGKMNINYTETNYKDFMKKLEEDRKK